MRGALLLTVMTLAAVSMGCANDRRAAKPIEESEVQQLVLARELEMMALTTSAAKLIRAGDTDRAIRLLEQRLASSLSHSGRLVDQGVRLPDTRTPSLADAPRRTAAYATAMGNRVMAAQANAIEAKLSIHAPKPK